MNLSSELAYLSSLLSSTPRRVSIPTFQPCPSQLIKIQRKPLVALAKKKSKNSQPEPALKRSFVEEISLEDEFEDDELFLEELEDDSQLEDDVDDEDDGFFDDEYFLGEEAEPSLGDGAGGGGISLAGTSWDKTALEIAEEVASSFNGELGIYAFKTMLNANIQVRIERLTNRSGSPNMMDIEDFTTAYRERLDEAESNGSIPPNISLEVSSPGVERVVRVPQDLDRFKERNMYVRYAASEAEISGSTSENDGIFRLVSFDSEARSCTWGLADVRTNREKSGKGRPLSKKQREWRLVTPFESLILVRLYSET